MALWRQPQTSPTDPPSSNLHRELLTSVGRAARDRAGLAVREDPVAQDPAALADPVAQDQEGRAARDPAALADRVGPGVRAGLADMSRVAPAVPEDMGPADPVALASRAARVGPADMGRADPVDRVVLASLGVRDRAGLRRMDRGPRARDPAEREPQDLSQVRAQPGRMPAHRDRAQLDPTPAHLDRTRPADPDPDPTPPADLRRTPADLPWGPTTRAEATRQEAEMRLAAATRQAAATQAAAIRRAAATLSNRPGLESRLPPGLLARSAYAVTRPIWVSVVDSVMRFTPNSQAV